VHNVWLAWCGQRQNNKLGNLMFSKPSQHGLNSLIQGYPKYFSLNRVERQANPSQNLDRVQTPSWRTEAELTGLHNRTKRTHPNPRNNHSQAHSPRRQRLLRLLRLPKRRRAKRNRHPNSRQQRQPYIGRRRHKTLPQKRIRRKNAHLLLLDHITHWQS